jgi:hypothetical protein
MFNGVSSEKFKLGRESLIELMLAITAIPAGPGLFDGVIQTTIIK